MNSYGCGCTLHMDKFGTCPCAKCIRNHQTNLNESIHELSVICGACMAVRKTSCASTATAITSLNKSSRLWLHHPLHGTSCCCSRRSLLTHAGSCGQGYEGAVAATCTNGAWTFVGSCTGALQPAGSQRCWPCWQTNIDHTNMMQQAASSKRFLMLLNHM
jgi:hypothetical protein